MRMVIVLFSALVLIVPSFTAADTLPRELSDDAFWRLVSDFSEEGGSFRFEYMSNEQLFQYVIPRLKENRKPGGVYLGVGPEQNFTYIAALQPKMAFIFDIRRQNMIEHLIYKAVFEMSFDRADFLSRLFSRKVPTSVTEKTTPRALFQAFRGSAADPELYRRNLQAIKDRLMKDHKFRLTAEDQSSIDYIYRIFFEAGSAFSYAGTYGGFGGSTYADLMTATDENGQARSYLACADDAGALDLALRRVGRYVKDHGAAVAAFYTSNVEQYLFQQGDDWSQFLASVSTFPLDASSTFIRSSHFAYGEASQRQLNRSRFIQLLSPMAEVTKAFNAGRLRSYEDLIQMSK